MGAPPGRRRGRDGGRGLLIQRAAASNPVHSRADRHRIGDGHTQTDRHRQPATHQSRQSTSAGAADADPHADTNCDGDPDRRGNRHALTANLSEAGSADRD